MKKGLYILLVLLLVVAFGASALYVGSYFLEGKKEADRYDELSAMIENTRQEEQNTVSETAPETTEATEASTAEVHSDAFGFPGDSGDPNAYYTPDVIDEPELIVERPETEELVSGNDFLPWYLDLHAQNPDMVGWLQIEGTKLNYPVLQTTEDNANYYLYRNFDRQESVRGSIYAWEKSDVFKPSDNITLFGHNMKDGSMFACLGAYYDKAAWENNPLIFFDTLTESHVYKIFAVFKTSGNDGEGFAYHMMADAADEAEFNEFVATCKNLSFYETGFTPKYGDKLICLSTCEYTLNNGRFVVAAVRIT